MGREAIRVLLIEDDRDDYLLTRDRLLEIPGKPFQLDWAETYQAGCDALARGEHDVCLLDYRLGAQTGLDLLREVRGTAPKPAVILMTGQAERELDLQALEAGVDDYLEKDRLDAQLLERAIRYALRQHQQSAELERRVAQRTAELAEANHTLRESARLKDEFLATLAHELRNPLAPVQYALEIMRFARGNPDAVDEATTVINRQIGQMVRLIDDLLDLSRIDRNKLQLLIEPVRLSQIFGSAIETSQPLFDRAGHTLLTSVPEEEVVLLADRVRLSQIIANLLNNAAKYTDSGGTIELAASVQGEELTIFVKDNGVGIPRDMLPLVFNMFTQVDRSLERSQGGLGIGLTLVQRLVQMHGGTVVADSEGTGRGCTFTLKLPVVTQAEPAVELPPSESDEAAVPLPGLRILVADDNRDSAINLAKLLTLQGHDVRTVHDGLEAVAAATAEMPDVALLDIGMPNLNGYDAARQIRALEAGNSVPLIAITGWGQDADIRKSREAGFDHHLVKPVKPEVLNALVSQVRQLVSESPR